MNWKQSLRRVTRIRYALRKGCKILNSVFKSLWDSLPFVSANKNTRSLPDAAHRKYKQTAPGTEDSNLIEGTTAGTDAELPEPEEAAVNQGSIRLSISDIDQNEGTTIRIDAERYGTAGAFGGAFCAYAVSPSSLVTANATGFLTWNAGVDGTASSPTLTLADVNGDQSGTITLSGFTGAAEGTPVQVTLDVRDVVSGSRFSVADALSEFPATATSQGFTAPTAPTVPDADPQVSGLTEVTITAGNILTEINNSNVHLHFPAGLDYVSLLGSTFNLSGSNKVLECADGVELPILNPQSGCDNVRLFATNPRMAEVHNIYAESGASDWLIDGMVVDRRSTAVSGGSRGIRFGANRWAMINSHVDTTEGYYGWYTSWWSVSGSGDYIIANCTHNMRTHGSPNTHFMRLTGVSRVFLLDVINDSVVGGANLRVHTGSTGGSQPIDDIVALRLKSAAQGSMFIEDPNDNNTAPISRIGKVYMEACEFLRDTDGSGSWNSPASDSSMGLGSNQAPALFNTNGCIIRHTDLTNIFNPAGSYRGAGQEAENWVTGSPTANSLVAPTTNWIDDELAAYDYRGS